MNYNFSNLIQWGIKLWLLVFPWQTLLIIRQVEKNGSLWSAAGLALPLSAVFLGLIGLLILMQVRIKPKAWQLGLITFLIFSVWRAPDSLLGLQWLFFWTLGGILCFFGKNFISHKNFLQYLALGSVLPIALGLYQFFTQTNFSSTWLGLAAIPSFMPGAPVIVSEWGRWLRASGPFPHPNIFAGYLVIVMVAIFSGLRNNFFTKKWHWFFYLLVIFLITVLLTTFSRSGILGLALLIGLEFFYFKKDTVLETRLLLWIVCLTAAVVMRLLWPIYKGRVFLSQPAPQERVAVTERITGISESIVIWKKHWLLGVGPGNYTVSLAKLQPNLAGYELQPVHNVFFLFLVEWGSLGLLLVLGGMVWLFKNGLIKLKFLLPCLPLLPLLLFDHYLYDIWAGIIILAIHISSTVYPHLGLTKPKN